MTTHEQDIDTALARLIAGESAEAVAKDFPELHAEVASYAALLAATARVKESKPSPSGLHVALQSVRTLPSKTAPTPSPFAFVQFTKYSFAYKSAIVVPVVLVVLVASGAYVLPQLGVGGNGAIPTGDIGTLQGLSDAQPATFSESASAPQTRTMMKTATLAPTAQPTLPQDTTLAAIYGPELAHDVQAVQADSMQVSSIADDTNDTQGYTDAYDENDF